MTGTSRRAGSNNRSALTEKLAMSTIAHDTALASIVADAGPHDTPYLHPFHGCRLVDLLRVPRFQEEVAASPAELTAHEAAIHDRNNDMPLDGRSEEHTSELQSLMRISYAVFFLTTKT